MQTGSAFKNKENIDSKNDQKQIASSRRSSVALGPARINADDQGNCLLIGYFVIFAISVLLIFLLAFVAVPDSVKNIKMQKQLAGTNMQACQHNFLFLDSQKNIKCKQYMSKTPSSAGFYLKDIKNLNQFLLFYLNLRQNIQNQNKIVKQTVNLTVYSAKTQIKNDHNFIKAENVIFSKEVSLDRVISNHQEDSTFFLDVFTDVSQSSDYYWQVQFGNNTYFNQPNRYYLQTYTITSGFSLFTILLRSGFFIVALIFFFQYHRKVLQLPKQLLSKEQRAIQFFSVLTLAFNDQLYFITILFPNPFTSFLSTFVIWNFIVGILLLWMYFLYRIKKHQTDSQTNFFKNKVRVFLLIIFYCIIFAYITAYTVYQFQPHPNLSVNQILSPRIVTFVSLVLVCIIASIIYIIYLIIGIICIRNSLLWRHKLFMVLSLLFFITLIVLLFVGSFDVYTYSSSKIMLTFGLMNLYSFCLQYLYSPSQVQIQRCAKGQRINIVVSQSNGQQWQKELNQEIFVAYQELNQDLQTSIRVQNSKKQESIKDRKMKRRQKHIKETLNRNISQTNQQIINEDHEPHDDKNNMSFE